MPNNPILATNVYKVNGKSYNGRVVNKGSPNKDYCE